MPQLDFKYFDIKLFHVRTFKKCTVAEADPDISIRGRGEGYRKKIKIQRRNSNRKLQNMVKRKMTRMNWKYSVKTRFYQSIT